jgi:hypothetical protein
MTTAPSPRGRTAGEAPGEPAVEVHAAEPGTTRPWHTSLFPPKTTTMQGSRLFVVTGDTPEEAAPTRSGDEPPDPDAHRVHRLTLLAWAGAVPALAAVTRTMGYAAEIRAPGNGASNGAWLLDTAEQVQ